MKKLFSEQYKYLLSTKHACYISIQLTGSFQLVNNSLARQNKSSYRLTTCTLHPDLVYLI